jgi:hypothetical protein
MQQVKWHFKGTQVSFITPKDKLTSAVLKQAARLGIDPKKTKIEIENEFFTLTDDTAGCNSCNGNSSSPELPTLQVDAEEAKTGPTADDMSDMLRLLDSLDTGVSLLPDDKPNLDLLGGSSDGLDD